MSDNNARDSIGGDVRDNDDGGNEKYYYQM